MTALNPYLFFNNNCREAMNFYQKCLGGSLEVITHGEAQGERCPLAHKDKVMHASLRREDLVLMASDTPDHPVSAGTNVSLSLACKSRDEIEKTFRALGEGGKVTNALFDAPWGAIFGTLTDKFGFHWMFNFEKPK